MTVFLSPIGNSAQISANGAPLNAGTISTFAAGTSTPQATYTDNTGITPQTNPIVLSTLGLPPSPIWLTAGQSYKFIIKDSLGNLIDTVEPIAGVNDVSAPIQGQLYTAFTTGGTSTAYTLTPNPAIAAYAANQSFFVKFHLACGAAPTLAISGLATPPNLVKENPDGTFSNLAAGDIPINHRSRVTLLSVTQAWVETLPDASLGRGQTWQDVTASRSLSTNFTNSTGRPIMVSVRGPVAASNSVVLTVSGIAIGQVSNAAASSANLTVVGIVPSGSTYQVTGLTSITAWTELR